ncbi:MAG: 5-(carboxyamino)imidazole ribonucleotide synthase [Acidobacteria bacterium]|nr:5-(carboxyamino)imidazole ribonucleotide synthase [Acidobacteriota bacterium]
MARTPFPPLLPGSTIGMLGSGQLGRMFAFAAHRLGYHVHTFSPDADSPMGQVSDAKFIHPYSDLDAVRKFARTVDVVTYEFENVSAEALAAAGEVVPVRPSVNILRTTQHRLLEKSFLADKGFPVAPFRAIRNGGDLKRAVADLGTPAVLKSARSGYDGKGQWRVESAVEAQAAFHEAKTDELIYETFVDFAMELSVVLCRDSHGNCADWGAIENVHANHILDISISPARVSSETAGTAVEFAKQIAQQLDLVGTMCVELFLTRDGKLLVNELAPRPHNSGHMTIEASVTSQYEQQLRAICGLSLGSTRMLGAAAMVNLMGELWSEGEPDWAGVCARPELKLHLYGKKEARPGRKMGHLTAVVRDIESAIKMVMDARSALARATEPRP